MPAVDANGNSVSAGDMAYIRTIPHWLIDNLPAEEVAAIKPCEGTSMRVFEIDSAGYVWFGSHGWFCLRPDEVEVTRD